MRFRALFLDLDTDVHTRFCGVRLYFSVLGFDFVEIAKLVQAENAQIPKRRIEYLRLVHEQFAPYEADRASSYCPENSIRLTMNCRSSSMLMVR